MQFARRISGRFFRWPDVDDIGWIPTYNLCLVEAPDLDARERIIVSERVADIF